MATRIRPFKLGKVVLSPSARKLIAAVSVDLAKFLNWHSRWFRAVDHHLICAIFNLRYGESAENVNRQRHISRWYVEPARVTLVIDTVLTDPPRRRTTYVNTLRK